MWAQRRAKEGSGYPSPFQVREIKRDKREGKKGEDVVCEHKEDLLLFRVVFKGE